MALSRPLQAFLLALALLYVGFESIGTKAFDFRAFYCAGWTVSHGGNPYRTEPLHTCERVRTDASYAWFARIAALPAPVPAYDLAVFVSLSKLPFSIAKAAWTLVLAAAVAVAAACLIGLTGISAISIFCCLWLSLVFPSLAYGELIPISIAGICFAALSARRQQWAFAALGGLVSLVEPHLGLPVCVVLAIASRRTWPVLGAGALLLGLLSLRTLPPTQIVEYFTTVLPLHAQSELASDAQLSLSVVLHYLGVGDAAALRAGAASYFLLLLLACYVGPILRKRFNDNAFVVAVPAAFAVVGGSFIHVTDMPAALPLALLLYCHLAEYRQALIAAICMLMLPWWHLALVVHQGQTAVIAMTAAVTLVVVWELSAKNLRTALIFSLAMTAMLIGINTWYVATSDAYHRTHRVAAISIDRNYPEASWAWSNARFISTGVPASWVLRAPTWAGLSVLLCVAIGCALSLTSSKADTRDTAASHAHYFQA